MNELDAFAISATARGPFTVSVTILPSEPGAPPGSEKHGPFETLAEAAAEALRIHLATGHHCGVWCSEMYMRAAAERGVLKRVSH